MVAALGYEAYRRSFGSTSRDQKGELQLMVQVGPHAHALFAAKAGKLNSPGARSSAYFWVFLGISGHFKMWH